VALMICPECAQQVSDRANTCPHCGCPVGRNAPTYLDNNPQWPRRRKSRYNFVLLMGAGFTIAITMAIIAVIIYTPAPPKRIVRPVKKVPPPKREVAKSVEYKGPLKLAGFRDSEDALGNIHVYFEVTNTSQKLCTYADFKILFTNRRDLAVGTGAANVTNIPAGGTKTVRGIGLDIQGADAYYVYPKNCMFE